MVLKNMDYKATGVTKHGLWMLLIIKFTFIFTTACKIPIISKGICVIRRFSFFHMQISLMLKFVMRNHLADQLKAAWIESYILCTVLHTALHYKWK